MYTSWNMKKSFYPKPTFAKKKKILQQKSNLEAFFRGWRKVIKKDLWAFELKAIVLSFSGYLLTDSKRSLGCDCHMAMCGSGQINAWTGFFNPKQGWCWISSWKYTQKEIEIEKKFKQDLVKIDKIYNSNGCTVHPSLKWDLCIKITFFF